LGMCCSDYPHFMRPFQRKKAKFSGIFAVSF
jgi:hypothetical protein